MFNLRKDLKTLSAHTTFPRYNIQALLSYLILIKQTTNLLQDIKLIDSSYKCTREQTFRISQKAFTGDDFNTQADGYSCPFSPILYLGGFQCSSARELLQC